MHPFFNIKMNLEFHTLFQKKPQNPEVNHINAFQQ